jgi:hypothetical protein
MTQAGSLLHASILLVLLLKYENDVHLKCWYAFSGLHGIISQKMELYNSCISLLTLKNLFSLVFRSTHPKINFK